MVFTKRYYGCLILVALGLIGVFIGAQIWVGTLVDQWMQGINIILVLAQLILLLAPILFGYREFVKLQDKPCVFVIQPSTTIEKSSGIWGSVGVLFCGVSLAAVGLLDGEYVNAISSLSVFMSLAMIIRLTVIGSTYAKVYEECILLPVGSIRLADIEGYRIQTHSTGHGSDFLLQFKVKKHYGIKVWMGIFPHMYLDQDNKDQIEVFLNGKNIPYQQYM